MRYGGDIDVSKPKDGFITKLMKLAIRPMSDYGLILIILSFADFAIMMTSLVMDRGALSPLLGWSITLLGISGFILIKLLSMVILLIVMEMLYAYSEYEGRIYKPVLCLYIIVLVISFINLFLFRL